MSHLGSRVSALVDGRLPAAEEERWWEHVHSCHPCRDLVEREGWVKTRLASLSFDPGAAPDRLKHSLMGTTPALRPEHLPIARPRHRGLAMIGGGAAGAAVVGVLALGAAGAPHVERRAPASDLSRPVTTSNVDPQARPVRRSRTPAPTTSARRRASRDLGGALGQTSGQPRSVPRPFDEVARRGTMAP